MIHVRFCDNGRGLTREQAAALTDSLEEGGDNSHIGLRNVHQRLKLAFGGKSRVEIASNAPGMHLAGAGTDAEAEYSPLTKDAGGVA